MLLFKCQLKTNRWRYHSGPTYSMKLLFTNTCKLNHDDLRKLEHQNTILTVMQREGQNTLSHSDVTKKGLMSHPTPSFFAVNRRPGTVSECAVSTFTCRCSGEEQTAADIQRKLWLIRPRFGFFWCRNNKQLTVDCVWITHQQYKVRSVSWSNAATMSMELNTYTVIAFDLRCQINRQPRASIAIGQGGYVPQYSNRGTLSRISAPLFEESSQVVFICWSHMAFYFTKMHILL